jgi:hypothetical protein
VSPEEFGVSPGKDLATEEIGATPVVAAEGSAVDTKEPPRGFLQAARRGLSEEELSTPAARRFLISEIERLDALCIEQQDYAKQYHDQRVIIATLTEITKSSRWTEILSFVCLTVGSAGLGAAPSYLSIPGATPIGLVFMGLSAILVIVGVASRIWK